ncbi:MAG: phage minor head protein [Myxococcota bacterium]
MRAAFLAAVQDLVDGAEIGRISDALQRGDIEAALQAVNIDPAAFDVVGEVFREGFVAGGVAAAATITGVKAPDGSALVFRFGVRAPRAERFLAEESSRLITRLTEATFEAVRASLVTGMQQGRNPRSVALDLVGRKETQAGRRRGGIIGLTARQEAYVAAARAELISGDPEQMRAYLGRADTMRDRRFDRTVLKAIREGRALDAATVNKIVGRYADNHLRLRGETVARTEILQAMNMSTREAYEQAIDTGAIARQEVKKVWRTASDARVRDPHGAINGTVVGIDERFGNGLLHPHEPGAPASEVVNCRCTTEYRIDFLARLGR